jgi:uncharacterized protein YjbI with pentapeptide repeats
MRRVLNSVWRWTGFGDRTLWEWMSLLIVPLVIVGATAVFSYFESEREHRRAEAQRKADIERAIALEQADNQRLQAQQRIEDDRVRHTLLESYIRDISDLLLHEKLAESPYLPATESGQQTQQVVLRQVLARRIARANTLTTVGQLDGDRKGLLLEFLYEVNLLYWFDCSQPDVLPSTRDEQQSPQRCKLIPTPVYLHGADLRDTVLVNVSLYGVNLSGADLSNADLNRNTFEWAELYGTVFRNANLSGAHLRNAYLGNADLCNANLSGADLREAHLSHGEAKYPGGKFPAGIVPPLFGGADLRGADLSGANLLSANLSFANLQGAK